MKVGACLSRGGLEVTVLLLLGPRPWWSHTIVCNIQNSGCAQISGALDLTKRWTMLPSFNNSRAIWRRGEFCHGVAAVKCTAEVTNSL